MSEVADSVAALKGLLNDIFEQLSPLRCIPEENGDISSEAVEEWMNRIESLQSLPPMAAAKLQTTMAYAIHALYLIFVRLKSAMNNTDTHTAHPVLEELERVKTYVGKIKKTEELLKNKRTSVNTVAAARLVKSALFDVEAASRKVQERMAQEKERTEIQSSEPTSSTPLLLDSPCSDDDEEETVEAVTESAKKKRNKRKRSKKNKKQKTEQ